MSPTLTSEAVEQAVGYVFQDAALLQAALLHPSRGGTVFERLEFLGDRVLGMAVADLLYEAYPNEAEGLLAKRLAVLVSKETLLSVGQAWGLQDSIKRIVTDTVEAVLAAVYLDGGWSAAKEVVQRHWHTLLMQPPAVDAKTLLQEYVQGKNQGTPQYTLCSMEGPSHAPLFIVEVRLSSGQTFRGEGTSKRNAEFSAARAALTRLGL